MSEPLASKNYWLVLLKNKCTSPKKNQTQTKQTHENTNTHKKEQNPKTNK